MLYNFAVKSFHTKKLCSNFKRSAIFYANRPSSVFEAPFGGLRDNVRWSS